MTAVVAWVALVLALAALVLAVLVARQNAEAIADQRTYRRAHADAHAESPPLNLGPRRSALRDDLPNEDVATGHMPRPVPPRPRSTP